MYSSRVPYAILPVAVFFAVFALCTQPLQGGRLAPDPLLATIDKVRLSVSSGDLGFDPIPNLDLQSLEAELGQHCARSLKSVDFEISASAPAYVLVVLDHAWKDPGRDTVALFMSISLRLPAKPVGVRDMPTAQRARSLEIWGDTALGLVPVSEAKQFILEAIDASLEVLVESRQGARRRLMPSRKSQQ